ncbi:MAG: helix-turn-helix domain-containing protein [Bacteroidota bacterium]
MKLITDFVLVIGIVLSILPIIGTMRLKEKSAPQYILVVFWALILNNIVHFYAMLHELSTLQFITNYLQHGVWFLIPPLAYVYVKSIFGERSNLMKKNIKHFIVFFVFFFDYIIPKSIDPNTTYINTIHQYFGNWSLIQDVFGIIYFLMALRLLYNYRKLMKYNYSNIGEEGFLWIEKFLMSFLMVVVVDLVITSTGMAVGQYIDWDAYTTIFFLVGAITFISYNGLTQPNVFLPQFLIKDIENSTHSNQPSNSYLKLSEKEGLTQRFRRCMRAEKMYLLQDLNSKVLAKAMETSERKLSAFFKEVLDSNFYDTVNAFRVEEAKQILKSEALKNQSITGIAHSCGFRSKSSFYRIFKKSTNLSPMDYVKMNIKESHHP